MNRECRCVCCLHMVPVERIHSGPLRASRVSASVGSRRSLRFLSRVYGKVSMDLKNSAVTIDHIRLCPRNDKRARILLPTWLLWQSVVTSNIRSTLHCIALDAITWCNPTNDPLNLLSSSCTHKTNCLPKQWIERERETNRTVAYCICTLTRIAITIRI